MKQQRKQKKIQRAAWFAKGFKYLVIAWVHPKEGGDDYCKEIVQKVPVEDRVIQYELKNSSVKTDFKRYIIQQDGSIKPYKP